MSAFRVRPYVPADHAAWLRLRRALWPDIPVDSEADEAAAWLAREDAVVLVAERPEGGGLAGFAEVGTRAYADDCETSPVAYLEGWYVDPDERLAGVGAALVHAAEAWARARGLRELASDTQVGNVVSQAAHLALGFAETGRVVQYRKPL